MNTLIIAIASIVALSILFLVTKRLRARFAKRFKELYKYFRLWLRDELANLLGTRPQKVQKVFDRTYGLMKCWGLIWPIVGAAWLSWDLDNLKRATANFIRILKTPNNSIFNHEINVGTAVFDVLSLLWLFIFLIVIFVEDRISLSKFKSLESAIIRAPNMNVFPDARSLLDRTYEDVADLMHFREEFYAGNYQNIKELITFLNTCALNIQKNAVDFFDSNAISRVNIMIYFKNDDEGQKAFLDFEKKAKPIYFRCDENKNLDGFLYLHKNLIDPSASYPPVIIPLYKSYKETYKNPNAEDSEHILPGAPLAYMNGTSMVGDTRDTKKYFDLFDLRTQKELKTFFNSGGEGKDIRSIASFRIPSLVGQSEYMGIVNLHSTLSYAFGENEEFFETFYTMIYPVLTMLAQELWVYKRYLIANPSA